MLSNRRQHKTTLFPGRRYFPSENHLTLLQVGNFPFRLKPLASHKVRILSQTMNGSNAVCAPKQSQISFNQFVKELTELPLGGSEHFFPFFGSGILTPGAAALSFYFDREIALLLQAMQQWIDRARAHLIAVPSKFFNHPEANQRLLRRVMKNVQSDETAHKLAMIGFLRSSWYDSLRHSRNRQLVTLGENREIYQAQSTDALSLFVIDRRYCSGSVNQKICSQPASRSGVISTLFSVLENHPVPWRIDR